MQVPRITQPCPLRFGAAPQPGLDFCGQCQRQVHNLDLLDEAQRRALVQRMGPVCVSYSVPVRSSRLQLAGAALVAGMLSACTATPDRVDQQSEGAMPLELETVTMLGGIKGGDSTEWLEPSELERPQAPALPHVDNGQWLPTPEPAGQ